MNVKIQRVEDCIVHMSRIEAMKVHISVVYDAKPYLVVAPISFWVTTEFLNEDVNVKSNTDWKVD